MAEAKATSKTKYATLAEALIAFQTDIPVIVKDSRADTGKYGYEYASLPVLTPILFKALTDVGIAYVAAPDMVDGVFVLRAELIHESGERLGGSYPLGNPNNPAQAIGSAITYARRYALLSLTGVSPEGSDDDGASASTAQASTPAAPKEGSTGDLRKQMGDLVNSNSDWVTGDDANSIMAEASGGKPPAGWTVAHLKVGKAQLETLIAERKAEKK